MMVDVEQQQVTCCQGAYGGGRGEGQSEVPVYLCDKVHDFAEVFDFLSLHHLGNMECTR
jgi:hypothetical protein